MSRIYVASSWRNTRQPEVVRRLREAGHEVYDFKHPREGDEGFRWSEISAGWEGWTPRQFRSALSHSIAESGFATDLDAMEWAAVCVLVLPCGRSAHLEAGWFAGQGKRLVILLDTQPEPELMYKFADSICLDLEEVIKTLRNPMQLCRVCGCTDEDCSGCIERTGEPCYWVEEDLCSACAAEDGA